MIPLRGRCFTDCLIPEGWERDRESYYRAAGESSKRRVQPQTKTAQDQLKRFAQNLKDDEARARREGYL